jgi:hypothetical protein
MGYRFGKAVLNKDEKKKMWPEGEEMDSFVK